MSIVQPSIVQSLATGVIVAASDKLLLKQPIDSKMGMDVLYSAGSDYVGCQAASYYVVKVNASKPMEMSLDSQYRMAQPVISGLIYAMLEKFLKSDESRPFLYKMLQQGLASVGASYAVPALGYGY